MAATAAAVLAHTPAPTAARIAQPRLALSGTPATDTGTPSVSATSRTSVGLCVMPPLIARSGIGRPATAAICSQLPRMANAMLSR